MITFQFHPEDVSPVGTYSFSETTYQESGLVRTAGIMVTRMVAGGQPDPWRATFYETDPQLSALRTAGYRPV